MSKLLIELPLLGVFTALLTAAIWSYMAEGMIFKGWYDLLKKFGDKGKRHKFIVKPLGTCPYCFGTWITILFSLLFCYLYKMDFVLIPLNIGTFWFVLSLCLKYKL